MGCHIGGGRFGARGDLFPYQFGELFRAPESCKSQGSLRKIVCIVSTSVVQMGGKIILIR